MILKSIALNNFRNFVDKKIEFSNEVIVIVGDNATGKTNVLEAIYLLATGKSFKARLEREIINYDADIARVRGEVCGMGYGVGSGTQKLTTNNQPLKTNLEVVLTNGEVELHGGGVQKAQRKKLLVNGVSKRLIDFAGNLKVVLFGPWDMDLVTASPSHRRGFLDHVLSQTDREYARSQMIYEKGLRQRNRLLLRIRDENLSRGQLMYWDRLLIKHGNYITEKRGEFVEFCNAQNMEWLFDNSSKLKVQNSKLKIKTKKLNLELNTNYHLEYDKSVISEGRLKQYEEEEIAAATTLVGPHRDDFIIEIRNTKHEIRNKSQNINSKLRNDEINGKWKMENGKFATRNLATYGSRGEQRMGILWLKLAELSYIENITGDKPVLLLDDIFSELDHEHRDVVMEVCRKQQTIITTADVHNIEHINKKNIIKINNARPSN